MILLLLIPILLVTLLGALLLMRAREQLAGLRATLEQKDVLLSGEIAKGEALRKHSLEAQEALFNLKSEYLQREAHNKACLEQAQEQLKQVDALKKALSEHFETLCAKSLQSNTQAFLDLAQGQFKQAHERHVDAQTQGNESLRAVISPIKETLKEVQEHVQALEKTRLTAYAGLTEQIKHLFESEQALKAQTGNLVQALRTPHVRGQWGELQLERVVELAGMVEHCDFSKQVTANHEDGLQRPDMLVRLPNGRNIVVDAKAPLLAYLESLELPDGPAHDEALKSHARHIREHITKLASKAYWKQFSPSPEFVVLFLPGEVFFSAALKQDPELLQFGIREKVILATPTTLVALLKAVAYGWQQASVAEQAQAISQLGRELYERLEVLAAHFSAMGKQIERTVDSYNKTLRCAQTRVFVTARKLQSFQFKDQKAIPEPEMIETRVLF